MEMTHIEKRYIENQTYSKLLILAAALFFGILFYELNRITPLATDDLSFSLIGTERITNLKQILFETWGDYFDWGGRSVVYALTRFFCLLGKNIFNIANTAVYIIVVSLIYLHANYGKRQKASLFIIINIMLWFFIPAFGESMLWLTGSCVYMWGGGIVLLALLPYRIYFTNTVERETKNVGNKMSFIKVLLMLLLGLMAGWTNENMGAALIAMLLLWTVYFKLKKLKIPAWGISGIIGAILGFLFLILAPGNFVRADIVLQTDKSFFIVRWIRSFVIISVQFIKYLSIPGMFALLAFILYYYLCKRKENHTLLARVIFYGIGVLAATYSMIVSPAFPPRTWNGILFIFVILSGNMFAELKTENIIIRRMLQVTVVCSFLAFTTSYRSEHTQVKMAYSEYKARLEMMEEARERGEKSIFLPIITNKSEYSLYDTCDLSENPEDNKGYAIYYGFDKIIGIK